VELDGEKSECVKLLGQYIEDQDADYQLDFILMKSCEPTLKKHCEVGEVGESIYSEIVI